MDISNSYQANNGLSLRSNTGVTLGYDLKAEKQEIEKITAEVKKELLLKWKKAYAHAAVFPAVIATMHPEALDFLLSFALVTAYDNVAKQAGLDAKGRNSLPHVVWQIAQTKKWDGLAQALETQLSGERLDIALVAELLQKNILGKVRLLSEKQIVRQVAEQEISKKTLQLALSEALLKYPKIGEQNITSNQITLRYFPTPVRPSIKNWVTDFHDAMGAMTHSPIDRGNFLFHSENGKKLSPTDRQKLGAILKSLDGQSLLTIDSETQNVIFENENRVEKKPESAEVTSAAGSDRIKREFRPDINLKQLQSQPEDFRQSALGELAPVAERETGQSRQLQEKILGFFSKSKSSDVKEELLLIPSEPQDNLNGKISFSPDFSAKANVERTENRIGAEKAQGQSAKNFFGSVVSASPFVDAPQAEKSAERNDFFAIPQSKPPLGSENFNASVLPKEDEKSQDKGVPTEESSLNKTTSQDLDLMSDDLLYTMLQEKKIKQGATNQTFNVANGSAGLSSLQKLPAEKIAPPAQAFVQQPVRSPFHIAPSDYAREQRAALPKVQGNTVDLRSN